MQPPRSSRSRTAASSTTRSSIASSPGSSSRAAIRPARARAGPRTQTHDKVAADASYVHGVVAMAKAGSEPAGTAGSQFFVVTGDDASLPPEYAVVGKVTSGHRRRRPDRQARRPRDRAADARRRHRPRHRRVVIASQPSCSRRARRHGTARRSNACSCPRFSTRSPRARSARSSSSPARTPSNPTRASSVPRVGARSRRVAALRPARPRRGDRRRRDRPCRWSRARPARGRPGRRSLAQRRRRSPGGHLRRTQPLASRPARSLRMGSTSPTKAHARSTSTRELRRPVASRRRRLRLVKRRAQRRELRLQLERHLLVRRGADVPA